MPLPVSMAVVQQTLRSARSEHEPVVLNAGRLAACPRSKAVAKIMVVLIFMLVEMVVLR